MQRRNLLRILRRARIAVDFRRIGLAGQRLQICIGHVIGKFPEDFIRQIRVRQLAPRIEFRARHLRIFDRQVQAAVRRKAFEQDFRKGTRCGIAALARASGNILHKMRRLAV